MKHRIPCARFLPAASLGLVLALLATAPAAEPADWWLTPQRMIQTKLRAIDATLDVPAREARLLKSGQVLAARIGADGTVSGTVPELAGR